MMLLLLVAGVAMAQEATTAGVGVGEVGGTVGALTGGGALAALLMERWFKSQDKTGEQLEAIKEDVQDVRVQLAALTAELRTGREMRRGHTLTPDVHHTRRD